MRGCSECPGTVTGHTWYYNADEDYYVCPMAKHLEHIGDVKSTSGIEYGSTVSKYRAQNCTGCPLRGICYKGMSDRRTIEVNQSSSKCLQG